jgi:hypothetical protein
MKRVRSGTPCCRDLVGAFGESYVAYRARTPMLVPRVPLPSRTKRRAEESGAELI